MNRISVEDFADKFYKETNRLYGTRGEFFNFSRRHGVVIPFIMNGETAVPGTSGASKQFQIPLGKNSATPDVTLFLSDLKEVSQINGAPASEEIAEDEIKEEDNIDHEMGEREYMTEMVGPARRPRGRPRKDKNISPAEVATVGPDLNSGPNVVIGNSAGAGDSFVPKKDKNFVPWGIHPEIEQIIRSGIFFPVYNTGLSGCGKTEGILQACARSGRECIRVNITTETDEDDLIGGFRLISGETVWVDGPVVEAAQRGAILLLDEIDLATPRIMALQPVLEGKPFFIKKIGKYVVPTPGFNVFATANTKGKGSASGHFVGTNFLNEAFLDRFSITLEHSYPTPAVEKRILSKFAADLFGTSIADKENDEVVRLVKFIDCLVDWASGIRKNFEAGTAEEIITTRRLLDIIKTFKIFGKIGKAVKYGISRFDEETKIAFSTYYAKIDDRVDNSLNDISTKDTLRSARGIYEKAVTF